MINDGNLALNSVQVTDCVTTSAITNRGILDLEDSLVRGNSGRGIANTDGTVTLVRSHVEGNRSETGAGIHNTRGDVVLIDGSAVTGNTATGDDGPFGGGILNFAGAVAIDGTSVVSGNAPDQCVDLGGGRGCP